MSKSDMDLTGIPGLPAPSPVVPPVKAVTVSKPAPSVMRSQRSTDSTMRGLPTGNPYFHDEYVPLNRKIRKGLVEALQRSSAELRAGGYKASDAELLQAVLHFGLPTNHAEAEALWQRWLLVKAAPPVRAKT